MNAQTEKRSTLVVEKKPAVLETGSTPEKKVDVNLREALAAIDTERNELAKKAIDGIKPGKSFDSSIVREINKLETKKNRLIVARFASLLRKNSAEVQAIAHQIIEL
jgi:hypothetical protein